MSFPAIRTEGLTKLYGDTVGIEDLDLTVEQGEVLGFLGPNGAGKTTTIRCLLDLIRPTAGRAEILGLDCREASLAARGRVGYLPGELSLWPEATGRETVEHLARLRGGHVDRDRIDELAERLEADLETPVGELSSGNRQKIGLVQALMGRPEVLVLDEPTRGLDPLVQREVLDLVGEVAARGNTVFFSSHVLDEVQRACDRAAIVRGGRLVTVEDVGEITHRGVRHVEFVFEEPPPEEAFASIEGFTDVEVDGRRLSGRMRGRVDPLVKAAARFEVVDVRSREPGLEEVFLAYYGEPDEPGEPSSPDGPGAGGGSRGA